MKNKLSELKNDLMKLIILLLILGALFKIVFLKENLGIIVKILISFYGTFLIPGFVVILYLRTKLGFVERVIIGSVLGISLIGVFSYLLNKINVPLSYAVIIIPIASIFVGFFVYFKQE